MCSVLYVKLRAELFQLYLDQRRTSNGETPLLSDSSIVSNFTCNLN
jgi:hypothetical protein